MLDQRYSDDSQTKRDIPSFIEPRPPLISNPFMRPRPQMGTNLLELFEEDSEIEEPELVQVYLRLKPYHEVNNLYEVKSDRCLITSVDTAPAGHGRRTQHNVSKMYTFSHIFGPESSQKEIFEKVVKDNLRKLPDGHSFTLLTYGASGSGKTYTLMGTVASPGLVPRSLEYVFHVVDAAQQPIFKPSDGGAEKLSNVQQEYELQWVNRLRRTSAPLRDKYRRMSAALSNDLTVSSIDLSNRTRHYVWVSFVEIYNEGIYDLLSASDRSNASKLQIREDSNGHVYVKGASQAFVRSGSEAYDVMTAGKHQLQVAATGVHAHSSRSHCIFTITMLTETDTGVRTSCVRLCDLAGCERARQTRNTGARMAESRAINSSLHVLERCLHTLRRRQKNRVPSATCVPYRESKLTRLLGAGLSGARGEGVAMVVTLNPAPQHHHQTEHVLRLATVARDIQVNSTISESTLESSTQNTTVNCSVDILRLRADNERLHFELLQAQSRNKELMALMEEKRQETANTMRELVEEAKDMMRQYYEAQIQSLKSQEKLTAERLARAAAEEEIQYLRTCIEERDEKSSGEKDVIDLSDSDHNSDEEDDDPLNESLEPTFKKEDIKKSRLLQTCLERNSLRYHSMRQSFHDNIEHATDFIENDSVTTFKDHDKSNEVTTKDSFYDTNKDDTTNYDNLVHDNEAICNASVAKATNQINTDTEIDDKLDNNSHYNTNECDNKVEVPITLTNEDSVNGVNFMTEHKLEHVTDKLEDDVEIKMSKFTTRATYFVRNDNMKENNTKLTVEATAELDNDAGKVSETTVDKIISSIKAKQGNDTSLTQFEQLEKAAIDCDGTRIGSDDFGHIKIFKEKKTYFDDAPLDIVSDNLEISPKVNIEKKTYIDDKDLIVAKNWNKKENVILTEKKKHDDTRSPSIVKDEIVDDFKPSTLKILLGESLTRQPDVISSVDRNSMLLKKHESIDIFDSPHANIATTESHDIIENARQSIKKLVLNQKSASKTSAKTDVRSGQLVIPEEPLKSAIDDKITDLTTVKKVQDKEGEQIDIIEKVVSHSEIKSETNQDNTIEEFENIYKDITAPRATEFDLLVSQEINDNKDDKTSFEETKYNLRHKPHAKDLRFADKVDKEETEEVLLESHAKCESRSKPTKRSLRLRKRKNQTESEDKSDHENEKLKDIVNLQKEFSDVCLDVPAPTKVVKDIISPEKPEEEENVPPLMGIQSCPAKSVTRSRRKLFTPRAEPLDEDEAPIGSGERLYVPRPSYHRARARRKL
ncbi:unnamed protein product [Diatraea saccharalis]|uniref:Kinesin motor domain-containing protein n=1 Tax=Diatraea saccharalis TaxID=40085 RepID=A0A9N9R2D3_9NEOP|nr:unnamed protein product [Diatraea saccharalis]